MGRIEVWDRHAQPKALGHSLNQNLGHQSPLDPSDPIATPLAPLSAYVARTAISNARIREVTAQSVSFGWKNRDAGHRPQTSTVSGVEFVQRYLRHVLPRGLRAIRYYGFCHPAAKANRLRVQLHTGRCLQFGATTVVAPPPALVPQCPCCREPMRLVYTFLSPYRQRGPPSLTAPSPFPLSA